ncbi:glutathione S-transferase family protein [Methylocystis sp. S23]
MSLSLVIGNKRYSSWSMRPWLVLKQFEIPFDEVLIPLYRPESKEKLLHFSPAGKVPALLHDGRCVWESLAIIEYVAELRPDLAIWPRDMAARALARSLACEMHAGFTALRQECPMNFGRPPGAASVSEAARRDAARIDDAWRDARARFGREGPFLFGPFCAADAMFAPVVRRLDNYRLPLSEESRSYASAIFALPAWKEWAQAGAAEIWRLEQFEVA